MLLFIAFLDWDDVEKKFFFYGKFVCIYTMEDLNYELEGDEGPLDLWMQNLVITLVKA